MTHRDVFISYSTKDNGEAQGHFVTAVKDALEAAGLDVWMDAIDMQTGMEWWPQIEDQIERSDNLVFIVSANSLNSEWCHKELAHARKHAKRIFSAIYEPVDPRELLAGWFEKPFEATARDNLTHLRRTQWLDEYAKQGSLPALHERLLLLVRTDPECIRAHTDLVLQTNLWLRDGRNLSRLLKGTALADAEQRQLDCEGKIEDGKLEYSDEQRAFIAESRRVEEEEKAQEARKQRLIRLLRMASVIFAVVALLAGGATVFAARQLTFAEFRERVTSALNERVIGSSSYLIGDFAGARTKYESALTMLNPDQQAWTNFTDAQYTDEGVDISTWLNDLGRACAEVRDYACAIDAFQDAIEVNTGYDNAYRNLANVYREDGQLDEARQTLATLEESGVVDVVDRLHFDRMMAAIEYDSGHYEEAIKLLDEWGETLKPRPEDDGAPILSAYYLDMVYYTALSYEGLGDPKMACDFWAEFQEARLRVPPNTSLVFWFNTKSAEAGRAFAACDFASTNEGV